MTKILFYLLIAVICSLRAQPLIELQCEDSNFRKNILGSLNISDDEAGQLVERELNNLVNNPNLTTEDYDVCIAQIMKLCSVAEKLNDPEKVARRCEIFQTKLKLVAEISAYSARVTSVTYVFWPLVLFVCSGVLHSSDFLFLQFSTGKTFRIVQTK